MLPRFDVGQLKFFLVVLIVFHLDCRIVYSARNKTRLNVVLVIFDDLRPAIGGYGDRLAKTPYLDAFINKSHYFTQAYSQQALCAPSRNSMLTSRRPDTLHLYDFYSYWRTFAGNFTTLPQYFKERGYYTYSIGKIFHPGISSNYTDDYPLSWSAYPFHPKTEKFMNSPVCPDASGVLKKNLICPVHVQTQPFKTLPDIESTAEAIRFIRSRSHIRKPFFMALGFHKPHINFRFPHQFMDQFSLSDFFNYTKDVNKPAGLPNVAWNPYTDIRSRDDFKHLNISFPFGPISELSRAHIRQAYYAAVSFVDDLFGKLMLEINESNTIVLVTSDHGWALGEHAEWAKYSNFDVALRVPLIIKSPELRFTGSKCHTCLVELVDVFPTLVDLAHLSSLPKCNTVDITVKQACTEGKSLFPLLKNTDFPYDQINYTALSQYPRPGLQPTKQPNSDKPKLKNIKVMGYSMRTEKFRYTLWVRFFAQNFTRDWTSIYGEEMYDHHLDSDEEINLVELPEYDHLRDGLRYKLISSFS